MDRELKWLYRALWALLAFNGVLAIDRAWHREWATMVAYLIWFANLCFCWRLMKAQERTRDLMRLHEAAVMRFLEFGARDRDDV